LKSFFTYTLAVAAPVLFFAGVMSKNASLISAHDGFTGEISKVKMRHPAISEKMAVSESCNTTFLLQKSPELSVKGKTEEVFFNPPLLAVKRRISTFDFNEKIQINLISIIGDKLTLEKKENQFVK
jgi:hypothetical protein